MPVLSLRPKRNEPLVAQYLRRTVTRRELKLRNCGCAFLVKTLRPACLFRFAACTTHAQKSQQQHIGAVRVFVFVLRQLTRTGLFLPSSPSIAVSGCRSLIVPLSLPMFHVFFSVPFFGPAEQQQWR